MPTEARCRPFLTRPFAPGCCSEGAPISVGWIEDKDKSDVPRFLNRLLGLAPEAQQQVGGGGDGGAAQGPNNVV